MPIQKHPYREDIDRANASGLQPVVFVHGLWLLAGSWDNWRKYFEDHGYTTIAPGWPDDPETVEEAKNDPEVFAHKHVKQVTDYYHEAINQLKIKPAVVGHSFGGLIAQRLAGEGASVATVAIAHASFKQQEKNPGVTEIQEIPDRGHSLTIDHGWQEVADVALGFIGKHLKK
ncbi:MAG TPA: alpha/beta fold hydrolase [Phototrophicaceae bacterium]|nr:alpha/beta fold hydrolase [Phototrophicaceae bacterium]